jgi:tetratricopeptide (TPR) repeat protein
MRPFGSWTSLVLLLALAPAGCRWLGHQDQATVSLAECRRLSRQGAALLDRGRTNDAEALLAKAVAACPTDADARRHYAEALWRRGARPEALVQLEEAGRLVADDAALWTRLGEMHLASGLLDRAWEDADRALDLDQKLARAWAVRGGVFRRAGQLPEALAADLRALGHAPKDRDILLETAEVYRQLNQPDRALQTLQGLAETYSPGEEPSQVEHLMGLAYFAQGRYDEAVECFSTAVARGQPTAEMFCRLGEAQLAAGRSTEDGAAARQALTLHAQHQPSLDLLERIRLAQQSQGTVQR